MVQINQAKLFNRLLKRRIRDAKNSLTQGKEPLSLKQKEYLSINYYTFYVPVDSGLKPDQQFRSSNYIAGTYEMPNGEIFVVIA